MYLIPSPPCEMQMQSSRQYFNFIAALLVLTSASFADERPDIAELTALLKSDNPHEAADAARVLGERGADAAEAVPQLVAALADHRPEYDGVLWTVSTVVSETLVAMGPAAVPDLLDALKSKTDDATLHEVIATLERIGPPAQGALHDLKTIVEGKRTESVRHRALLAYCAISDDGDERLALLERFLPDYSAHLRASAAWSLGRMGERAAFAVPVLVTGFDDHDQFNLLISRHAAWTYTVREEFIKALGDIGPAAAEAREPLLKVMNGNSNDRIAAALSISRIDPGHDEAMEFLVSQLNTRDEEFLGTSLRAAEALTQLIPQDDRAFAAIRSALKYPNDDYRTELVWDLGDVRDKKVVALLTMVLRGIDETDDRTARAAAAEALGDLGELAAPAVDDLVDALYSNIDAVVREENRGQSSETVFWHAVTALGKVGLSAQSSLDDLELIRQSLDDGEYKTLVEETIDKIESQRQSM